MRLHQRGSISLVVAAALAMAGILAAFAADMSRASVARTRAQTAADAAALAAAQELVVPSGRDPAAAARAYAERHGARLATCRCAPVGDDVVVEVELDVGLPLLGGTRSVRAAARAVVAVPSGSVGLQPWFAARLGCLFDAVPGLSIVSGFRTRAEQARLHREKPGLAAPPGHSMHELGLAADLAFPSDVAETTAHSRAGGCLLEFPVPHEPWHVEPAGP